MGQSNQNINEIPLKRYLLGQFSPEEQDLFEQRLLVSDDYYQQLLIVEEEIVDDYLNGHLSKDERERFERYFLSTPERQQKLSFARAFRRYVSVASQATSPALSATVAPSQPTSESGLFSFLHIRKPVLAWVLTAAVVLFLIGGSLFLFKNRPRTQGSQTQAQQVTPQEPQPLERKPEPPKQVAENPQGEQQQPSRTGTGPEKTIPHIAQKPDRGPNRETVGPRPAILAFTLTPGMVRETGELKRVSVPQHAGPAQVTLNVRTGEYTQYSAALQTAEGQVLWTKKGLRVRATNNGPVIRLSLPAGLLKGGDYQLKLSGLTAQGMLEDVDMYPFRILSK